MRFMGNSLSLPAKSIVALFDLLQISGLITGDGYFIYNPHVLNADFK